MKKYETNLSKKYNRQIKVEDVICELKKCGFDTVFFNTPKGDDLLALYKIDPGESSGFAYRGAVSIIFVDDKLSESDKLCVLLHELGHIKLGHLESSVARHRDNKILELEADAFAYSILKPKRASVAHILIVVMLAALIFVLGGFGGAFLTTAQSKNMVCVTQSGEKFHRPSCIHTKNKNYAELSRSEALKCFEPCKVCNP